MCQRGKCIANLSTPMRKHSYSSDTSFYMKADAEPNKSHPDGERSPPSTKIPALLLACSALLVPGKALVTLHLPACFPSNWEFYRDDQRES